MNSAKKLKVLMVSAEASPYASVGGAGSVIANLSKALVKIGCDVRVFIPKFGLIDSNVYPMDTAFVGLRVPTDDPTTPELICNVKTLKTDSGVTFYFLENQEYFEKRANVYGYSDDPTRFLLLSRGAIEFIKTKIFVPDVIHCNDWHTGALPCYLKSTYKDDALLKDISTIYTIHNLAFQGIADHRHVSELNYDDGRSRFGSFFSDRTLTLNFMRRGILYADAVNTVSKTYAKEILTPEFGEGLDKLLLELRGKLFGIVNGIDYDDYNPLTDRLIAKNYDVNSLAARSANKTALQKEFDLPVNPDTMVFGYVGRLDFMKGVDMLISVMKQALKEFDIQFVQVGAGDWNLIEHLQKLKQAFPKKVGIHTYPNFTLPKLVFAGSDCMVVPSRFEPCGIVPIEGMRYGSVPIVRKVGGLSDIVTDFDAVKLTGTGFVFNDFNELSLYGQIARAYELHKHPHIWSSLVIADMYEDFSWGFSAGEYVKLYENATTLRLSGGLRDGTLEGAFGLI